MKNLRNEKGITLVALVVTIIVLLILAGVSLSLVAGGNGIINKAATAQDKTLDSSAKEQVELKLAEAAADYYEDKYVNGNSSIGDKKTYVEGKVVGSVGDYTVAGTSGSFTVTKTSNSKQVATFSIDDEGKIDTWTGTGTTTP